MTDTRLSIRVTEGFRWQLKEFAAEQRQTVTEIVMAAVREYATERGYTIYPDEAE